MSSKSLRLGVTAGLGVVVVALAGFSPGLAGARQPAAIQGVLGSPAAIQGVLGSPAAVATSGVWSPRTLRILRGAKAKKRLVKRRGKAKVSGATRRQYSSNSKGRVSVALRIDKPIAVKRITLKLVTVGKSPKTRKVRIRRLRTRKSLVGLKRLSLRRVAPGSRVRLKVIVSGRKARTAKLRLSTPRFRGATLNPPSASPAPPVVDAPGSGTMPPAPPVEEDPGEDQLPGGQPGAVNTGVRSPDRLTVHEGDLVLSTPGAVVERLDVRGFVFVKAPNVVIRDSIVRGGVAPRDIGLVNVTDAQASLLIEDSTLVPAHPSYRIDGIRGANFTMRRVEVTGTVDGAHLHGVSGDRASGGNVRIEASWLHDLKFYPNDPRHSDGSHNDAVQVIGGRNITITGNTLSDANNAAVMLTDGSQDVGNVLIDQNWADGGGCTFNIDQRVNPIPGMTVTDNLIGPNSQFNCGIIIDSVINPTMSGNVWEATGQPTSIVWR